jgi:hypothetical protein
MSNEGMLRFSSTANPELRSRLMCVPKEDKSETKIVMDTRANPISPYFNDRLRLPSG